MRKLLALLILLVAGPFGLLTEPARSEQFDRQSLAAKVGPSAPLAGFLTILNVPARGIACGMSGVLGSVVMMASGGARYDLAAEIVGEGCSGPWIISRQMVYESLLEKEKPPPPFTIDDMVLPARKPEPISSLEELGRGETPSSSIQDATLTPSGPETSSLEAFRRGESPLTRPSDPLQEIYFDFDRYDLRADARETLNGNGDWLKANPSVQWVEIEGHSDERGTNEYNLALGSKRAQAAKDYLVGLGVAPERLSTKSYGEELPVCREPTEECWQRNRRVRFVIVRPAPAS